MRQWPPWLITPGTPESFVSIQYSSSICLEEGKVSPHHHSLVKKCCWIPLTTAAAAAAAVPHEDQDVPDLLGTVLLFMCSIAVWRLAAATLSPFLLRRRRRLKFMRRRPAEKDMSREKRVATYSREKRDAAWPRNFSDGLLVKGSLKLSNWKGFFVVVYIFWAKKKQDPLLGPYDYWTCSCRGSEGRPNGGGCTVGQALDQIWSEM